MGWSKLKWYLLLPILACCKKLYEKLSNLNLGLGTPVLGPVELCQLNPAIVIFAAVPTATASLLCALDWLLPGFSLAPHNAHKSRTMTRVQHWAGRSWGLYLNLLVLIVCAYLFVKFYFTKQAGITWNIRGIFKNPNIVSLLLLKPNSCWFLGTYRVFRNDCQK